MKLKATFKEWQQTQNGFKYAVFSCPACDVPLKIKVTENNAEELVQYSESGNIVRIEVRPVHYNGSNFLGFSL